MVMPQFNVDEIYAEDLNELSTAIDNLRSPGWTNWASSIAWTSSGVAPALGNAVKTAEYRRPTDMDMLDGWMVVTFGGTSTFGTGVHFWTLPVAAHANMVGHAIGTAYALDAGTAEYGGIIKCETTTTFRVMPAVNSADDESNWGPTTPFTWVSTDIVRAFFRYRPA